MLYPLVEGVIAPVVVGGGVVACGLVSPSLMAYVTGEEGCVCGGVASCGMPLRVRLTGVCESPWPCCGSWALALCVSVAVFGDTAVDALA